MATSIRLVSPVPPIESIPPVTPSYIQINGCYFAVTAFLGDTQVSTPSASVAIKVAKLFEQELPTLSKITFSVERQDQNLITTPLPLFGETDTCFEHFPDPLKEYVIRNTIAEYKETGATEVDIGGEAVHSSGSDRSSPIQWEQTRTPTHSERGSTPLPTFEELRRRTDELLLRNELLSIRDEQLKLETEEVLRSREAMVPHSVARRSETPFDGRSLSPEMLTSVFGGEEGDPVADSGSRSSSLRSSPQTVFHDGRSTSSVDGEAASTSRILLPLINTIQDADIKIRSVQRIIGRQRETTLSIRETKLELIKLNIELEGVKRNLEEAFQRLNGLEDSSLQQTITFLIERAYKIIQDINEQLLSLALSSSEPEVARGSQNSLLTDSQLFEQADASLLGLRITLAAAQQTLDQRSFLLKRPEATGHVERSPNTPPRTSVSPALTIRNLQRLERDGYDSLFSAFRRPIVATVLHVRNETGNSLPSVTAFVRPPDYDADSSSDGEDSPTLTVRSGGSLLNYTPERRLEGLTGGTGFTSLPDPFEADPNELRQIQEEQHRLRSSSLGTWSRRDSEEGLYLSGVQVRSRSSSLNSLTSGTQQAQRVQWVVVPSEDSGSEGRDGVQWVEYESPSPSPHLLIADPDATTVGTSNLSQVTRTTDDDEDSAVGSQRRPITSPTPGSLPRPTTPARGQRKPATEEDVKNRTGCAQDCLVQ